MDLKKQAKNLEPVMRIGKNGLSEAVLIEIQKLLKKRELIKIKVLNDSPIEDLDEAIEKITKVSGSKLILKIGNTFSIY